MWPKNCQISFKLYYKAFYATSKSSGQIAHYNAVSTALCNKMFIFITSFKNSSQIHVLVLIVVSYYLAASILAWL